MLKIYAVLPPFTPRMTTRDEDIQTETSFHNRLETMLTTAESNGIDIRGSWPVSTGESDRPNWDIEIVRLELEE